MKEITKLLLIGLISTFLVVLTAGNSFSASSVTIQGVVGEYCEFTCIDGEVYEIANTTKGNELARNFNKRAEVKGTITEDKDQGVSIITVSSFRILH
ncbi:hypothetical protein ACFL1Z_02175 [Thermodesulfobacteriota bacterium]